MALRRSSKWLVFGASVVLVLAWAWWPSCEGDGSVKDVLACSQVNRNYGLMVAGLFALVALYLNWQRTANDRRRTVNDTYVKAVEQLGHAKMEVRLGAIYALERIAATDRDYHWPIMETLCAYIRERPAAKWGEEPATEAVESGESAPAEPPLGSSSAEEEVERKGDKTEPKRPPTDIQAILTVFERRAEERKAWEEAQGLRLNLRHADLAGTVLTQVRLQRADLSFADLTGASLWGAKLGDPDLTGADLAGANLRRAVLRGVDMLGADLTGAFLWNADMLGANLSFADLRGAKLKAAKLAGADMRGAKFSKHPRELGANCDRAKNLDKIIIEDE